MKNNTAATRSTKGLAANLIFTFRAISPKFCKLSVSTTARAVAFVTCTTCPFFLAYTLLSYIASQLTAGK